MSYMKTTAPSLAQRMQRCWTSSLIRPTSQWPWGQRIAGSLAGSSAAMGTFRTLNTSTITLIPGTIIALRATYKSVNPAEVVGATLVASVIAGIFGIWLDWLVRKLNRARGR